MAALKTCSPAPGEFWIPMVVEAPRPAELFAAFTASVMSRKIPCNAFVFADAPAIHKNFRILNAPSNSRTAVAGPFGRNLEMFPIQP